MIYVWDFPADAIQVIPSVDELTDIVYKVRYRLAAVDEIYQAYHKGEVSLLAPSPELFLPYKEITKELLAQWVEEAIEGFDLIKANLAQEVEALKLHPFAVEKELPWRITE